MYLLPTVLAFSGPAAACPGPADASSIEPDPVDGECAEHDDPRAVRLVAIDPARSARMPELVGPEACTWTTSMMAQRVLEQGTPWTYVGRLATSAEPLRSRVASPFTLGPEHRIHVVANQILEQLDALGDARVELAGRVLEVDGITYFVATELVPAS